MGCGTFYHQFKVLTWKNNILRRRNLRAWLIEILVPVLLTVGMLAIYKTIKPRRVPDQVPEMGQTVRFDQFHTAFGAPQCTWYDSNVFWRCPRRNCQDPATQCDRLVFATAPAVAGDPAATAAATLLAARVQQATGNAQPTLVFPSEQALDDYIMQPGYARNASLSNIGVAVVFDAGAPAWSYHLRMNRTVNDGFNYLTPPTKLTTDSLLRNGQGMPVACSRCSMPYLQQWYYSGGLAVQNLVDSFIVSQAAGGPVQLSASVVDFPAPGYEEAGFWGIVSNFYGIFMVIAILYPVSNVVRSLVMEKEARIREGMRMMALTDAALYASWAFHFATTFTIIAGLIVAVGGKLFQHSDRGLIFLYYLLFFYSTTAFSFWMSTFFSKSKTAAILGVLPYFGGYFITMALKPGSTRMAKLLACLHPSAAFTLAMSAFTEYEDAGQGITRLTAATSATGNFAFADAVGMMLLDVLLYAALFWYFDKVWPSEFGTRRPPHFLLLPSYWRSLLPRGLGCFGRGAGPARTAVVDVEAALAQELTPDVERVPASLAQQIKDGSCIFIRGLCKSFKTNTGIKHAVDNLNLTMYSGQITALLGHNGAGKSTTIGILSGLTAPTSGTALINGRDVTRDMGAIRHSLGVCPQHDVLFPDLSVEEHLTLFAAFKGVPAQDIPGQVEAMIKEVGLTEKRKVASKNLSGGMKRKLSVGIAFIGGSKVVFLDEPTSGMDPYSRRFTWNVIRKYREGRTIILTTHFLEEADILGDRIAIMNKGKLRACGSSLFLKNHFGVGYSLTIEKQPAADANRIQAFVFKRLPEARLLSCVGAEVSFQLPRAAAKDFKAAFEALDAHKAQLGVETYGVSVTTLEEVFIRVTRGDEADAAGRAAVSVRRQSLEERRLSMELERRRSSLADADADASQSGPGGSNNGSNSNKNKTKEDPFAAQGAAAPPAGAASPPAKGEGEEEEGEAAAHVDYNDHWRFFRRHMYALLVKRALYFKRDKKAWAYQFVMPALFILVGCVLMRSGINSIFAEVLPPLPLGLEGFNPGIRVDPDPFPFNADGGPFRYQRWEQGGQWVDSPSVTGQAALLAGVPDAASLPVYALPNAVSVLNMSQALLLTRGQWRASRYGAVSFAVVDPTGAGAGAAGPEFVYNVHANYSGPHAAPVFQNLVNDAILRSYLPGASIRTTVSPLRVTGSEVNTASAFDGFPVAVMILLSFAFVPAAFALFVVRERETKAKHLQVVSGVSFLSYWLSTWLFDFASFQIPLWLTVAILKGFDAKALMDGDAFGATVLLLELYGASITGFTYLTSFAFARHSMAQVGTILLNFLFGLILTIVVIIMTFIPTTRTPARALVHAFRVVPAFALGNGLVNVVFKDYFALLDNTRYKTFDLPIAGYNILYMAAETVLFFLATLLLEYLIRRPALAKLLGGAPLSAAPERAEKDEDVVREEERVAGGGADGDAVVVKGMTKTYKGGKQAVRGISLGIPNGECFGLLGINGAGKTTTLSILTAEFPPSSGDVRLGGYDIAQNPEVVRRLVGYCPQFDALFDLLTGREHLELYARVKGLSEAQVKEVVDKKVKEMDLIEYAGRNASTYSGGNKRKLSVAMAMIGRPLIVFLDEPSTGVDPVARRFMWQVISDITTKRGECCVILTTHSMEECEALCTRIGIMVGGRFRCLGPAQRLKSRFGMGYQVEIAVALPPASDVASLTSLLETVISEGRITLPEVPKALEAIQKPCWAERIAPQGSGADIWQACTAAGSVGLREFAAWCRLERRLDAVLAFVEANYPGAVLRERQGAKLRFEIPSKGHSLAALFGAIEDVKAELCVEDYSVSQTSLEQVFNSFAAQQQEETGPAAGIVSTGAASAPSASASAPVAVAVVGDNNN